MNDLAKGINEAATSEIRDEYRALAKEMVDEARKILRTGTPQLKQSLLKSVVPTVIRDSLQEKHEDEDLKTMKTRLDALMDEIRAGIGTRPVVAPEEDIPEDEPGAPA